MDKIEALKNSIVEGICGDIQRARKANALRGSLILTYCGIDAMAFLSMPENQSEVTKTDFVGWIDQYMRVNNEEKSFYPSQDLYGGRCALVHAYGSESKLSVAGKTRRVGYRYGFSIHNLNDSRMVLIDGDLFINDFLNGVEKFLRDAQTDHSLLRRIDSRINVLLCKFDT